MVLNRNFQILCRTGCRSRTIYATLWYWALLSTLYLRYLVRWVFGGAGSEAWNRVYMIAQVKKFGRVGLSTNFYSKQTWRWRRRRISLYLAYVCLCRFSIILALPSLNIQGKVSIAFFTFLIWFCCLFCFFCYWFYFWSIFWHISHSPFASVNSSCAHAPPPRANPRALAFFFCRMANSRGVGTL